MDWGVIHCYEIAFKWKSIDLFDKDVYIGLSLSFPALFSLPQVMTVLPVLTQSVLVCPAGVLASLLLGPAVHSVVSM